MSASHSCSPVVTSPITPSLSGRVGLRNLGNTCYINAAVQCIAHTSLLIPYFLDSAYERDINPHNVLGTGGKLVTTFSELMQLIWSTETASISPAQLKHDIVTFASQFKGSDQHDSQELLSILLDGLHEDLNTPTNTPPSPIPDHLPEPEIANLLWQQHLERNSSIISKEMHGQYRSQTTCLKCNKTSVKFDPFLMLSVEIPPPPSSLEVRIVPKGFETPVKVVGFVHVGDVKVQTLQTKITELIGEFNTEFLICEMDKTNREIHPVVNQTRIQSKFLYFAYEIDSTISENAIPVLLSLYREDRTFGFTQTKLVTAPRLLQMQEHSTLEDLHFRVFEAVKPVLRSDWMYADPQAMDVDIPGTETELIYRRLYTDKANFTTRSSPLYSLKVMSYHEHWNYGNSGKEACPYCNSVHFNACSVPFTSTSLRDFIQNQDKKEILQLEITCPQGEIDRRYWMLEDFDPSIESAEQLIEREKENSVSLQQCLSFTCTEKILSEGNSWFCPLCKEEVESSTKMTLYRIPRILLIHLKRFNETAYLPTKNDKLVDFPVKSMKFECFSGGEKVPLYDLFGVIEHCGSLSFGHYTALCRDEEGWARFDDEQVTPLREESEVVTRQAYVLFYQARE